jgi:predicted short-subunit dehydrogenase-like oxidoreductase (DUF2520 family)
MRVTSPPGAFALVGPGRAGTAVALALAERGWRPVAVAGRTVDAASTQSVAARLGAPAVDVADAGRDADVVVVATPDAAIARAATALAPSLRRGALALHLSGASTLHELDGVLLARPDVEVGSLHPLQSLPSGEVGRGGGGFADRRRKAGACDGAKIGADRLAGSWCAIDGSPRVERLALTLGMRPFRIDPADRVGYHAAACVASNHLVALLGQVERLAASVGVPFEAFLPLVRRTLDNVADLGPAAALTGPVARGDYETVARHIDALPVDERDAYRALASEARRLAASDDGEARSDLEGTVA